MMWIMVKSKSSAQKAVKQYKGTLDIIYLFCNKALTTTCDGLYRGVEKLLQDADIDVTADNRYDNT